MSSSNNDDNNGENDNGVGRAYSTNEEYPKHLNRNDVRSTASMVEYLEYLAEQDQYSPGNLSLHQDSLPELPQLPQLQPTKEQSIISPDNNSQQQSSTIDNNKISNSNIIDNTNNYNPYFPQTEQQLYNYKYTSNLSPLDEVVHSPNQYQIDDTNQQIYQQSSQYQQQSEQLPQMQQFQRYHDNYNNIDYNQSQKDHSAAIPSPLSLPGLPLSRNRSRVSTPRIENSPRIPSAYTAQVQQSDSPLRTEFRNSDLDDSDSDSSKKDNNIKDILGEILNKDRLTNFKVRTIAENSNESLVKFGFRNADGDPDDPLLNKNVQIPEEEQSLPTGLLTGNINNNNNNSVDYTTRQHSSIISPTSANSATPIIQTSNENEGGRHDVKVGSIEIRILKPKQGAVLLLLAVFIVAAMIFITWELSNFGVGNARGIFIASTNNDFLISNKNQPTSIFSPSR